MRKAKIEASEALARRSLDVMAVDAARAKKFPCINT
jgi:hypothetical protein